ncbi:MAG: DUF2267 domain-containing protein [Chloroflexi bacterium]|nr:DUF2267 domain-containing protein [Chloroflexota bacterium]
MNELVSLVAQKTGMSEEMAKTAVDTVINYLKEKLPAPLAAQIDGVLGSTGSTQNPSDMLKGLGGILGKK